MKFVQHYCWDHLIIRSYTLAMNAIAYEADLHLRCEVCRDYHDLKIKKLSAEQAQRIFRYQEDGTVVNFQCTPEGVVKLIEASIAPPRFSFGLAHHKAVQRAENIDG